MRQWLSAVQANPWVLIPRLFALIYGILGFMYVIASALSLFSVLFAQYAVARRPPILGVFLALVIILVFSGLYLILAHGFWYYLAWAPGLAIAFHVFLLMSPVIEIWESRATLRAIGMLIANSVAILLLLYPPIRRLFQ